MKSLESGTTTLTLALSLRAREPADRRVGTAHQVEFKAVGGAHPTKLRAREREERETPRAGKADHG